MILERITEIQKLTAEEKLILAEELWDDLAFGNQNALSHDEIVKLVERREKEYEANPQDVVSWEQVRDRARASRKS